MHILVEEKLILTVCGIVHISCAQNLGRETVTTTSKYNNKMEYMALF